MPKNQNLILTPHQQRVHGGECICDKNQFPPKNLPPCECTGDCQCKAGKYLKPFARRGTICKCRSVLGSVYNVEVYRALNTRGGAIWARFEDERRSEERNQQGVDQLGAREEPKAEKA